MSEFYLPSIYVSMFFYMYILTFRQLISLIQRVKQLNVKQHNNRFKLPTSPKIDCFNHNELIINSFERFSIQKVNNVIQQQHTSIWPTMLQPMSSKYAHGEHISRKNYIIIISTSNLFKFDILVFNY